MVRATLAAVAVLVLSGCGTLSDPTEEEGVLSLRNELPTTVSVGYCDSRACHSTAWIDSVAPGARSADSINAAKGTSARFIVRAGGRVLGCHRLSFPHGPFGKLTFVVTHSSLGRCPA